MAYKPPKRAGATVIVWANYSLAERERRWKAVRERGASAGFDCLFVPLGNGTDARYLTQLRCSSMVLPMDGRTPIVIADRSSRNEWVPEPWQTSREWAEPMAEALIKAGMEQAKIGVVGVKGGKVTHVRATDGVVNHSAFAEVKRRLPKATFEDATDIVGFVRYVKSEEEITCLKRAAAIADAGIDEIAQVARPGMDAAVLYAEVMERMLELGSEYFPLAITTDPIGVPEPQRYTNPPIGRRLEKNALIRNEVNAVWGAEVAQAVHPILLGPIPDEWKPVIELHREVFEAGLKFMKPRTSFGDTIDFVNNFGQSRKMKTLIGLEGCGYGDDGPVISRASRGEHVRELRLEKGNLFVWKPCVMTADERIQFVWGGAVVVTEEGGEMIFDRPHGMMSIA